MNKVIRYFAKRLSSKISYPLCRPAEITIIITNRCNFRCTHCDVWKTKLEGKELGTFEWKGIIKNLTEWLGCFNLTISGGEPLLRADIFKILKYCHFLGIKTVINTNGYLINQKVAKKIVKYTSGVKLSLYGLGKNHNQLRNIEGAYEHAISAVNNLKKIDKRKKIVITIALLLNSQNLKHLERHLKWIRKNDLRLLIQVLDEKKMLSIGNHYIKDDPAWREKSKLWPKDKEKINRAFQTIEYFRNRGLKVVNSRSWLKSAKKYFLDPTYIKKAPCFIAYDSMLINAFGRALFCFESGPLDNLIGKKNIKKLWTSKHWNKKRSDLTNCQRGCRVKCNYAAKIYDYL